MKLANIGEQNLHIFWTTRRISMKFSGKKSLMIILKVTKKQGFTPPPSQENTVLENPLGVKLTPPQPFQGWAPWTFD